MNNSSENKITKQEWLEKNAGRFMVSEYETIKRPDEDEKDSGEEA